MKYDQTNIPAAYDRGRDHGPGVLQLWMNAMAAHLAGQSISRILDLGCGTGRFSQGLAQHFDAQVVGLDPSTRMLWQAQAKSDDPRLCYQLACAEAIPLATQSIDMIFLSMSFHHFADPGRAAHECRRVLREQGTVFVRTASREQAAHYPYVPFFPASRPLLEQYLPNIATVRATFEDAGFELVVAEIIIQTIAPDWPSYAEKIAAGADSILVRLEQKDFESGLAALRNHVGPVDANGIVEPIDLLVFR